MKQTIFLGNICGYFAATKKRQPPRRSVVIANAA